MTAFSSPHNLAFGHCRGGRHAARLAGQATFAAEFIWPQDCDDGFLPLLGNDGDFDLAVMDVKDGQSATAPCKKTI